MKLALRILVFLMLCATLLTTVSATSAYSTYTYSADGYVLSSPDAYVPELVVDSEYSLAYFEYITDIVTDKEGNVYIADPSQQCVYVLDPYYRKVATISYYYNEQGVYDILQMPMGIFVTDDYIYVCDTLGAKIVMFDKHDYSFVKTVPQPVSNLFGENAIYSPTAVAVDAYGRIFVVSRTTIEGIIVMSDNGDFYGFIGAQKVTATSGISALLERLGLKDENKDENISSEYNNITIDDDNFIYATINSIDPEVQQNAISSKDGTYAPVKKFNASGMDVLRRNGFYAPSGEVKVDNDNKKTDGITGASSIIDAAVGPEGTWSIADAKRSKIYTYDAEGNLLFAFGDMGSQTGNITLISGLCYQGDKLLVADISRSTFTVYRRTEYGDILINALRNQNERNYDLAVTDWQEILKRNNNFDLAYIGIGKALARDGEYEKAMVYFKASHEKENRYSAAYKEVRKEWASKYFIFIPIIIVAVLVGLVFFFSYAGKVNKRTALKVGTKTIGEEFLFAFHIMVHPFDGFWDLKHEKRGSVKSAFLILLLTIVTFAYRSLGTGYIFNDGKTAADYSGIYSTIISVVVPVLLWVVSNWCLTTLFDGEGKFGDIFIATCYSLIPVPLFFIPSTILSNVLVADEKAILTTFEIIAWLWAGMLLYIGMMQTHGYGFFKNLITILATIVVMVIIMFLAVLFFELMAKLVNLFTQLWLEISFRA